MKKLFDNRVLMPSYSYDQSNKDYFLDMSRKFRLKNFQLIKEDE